MFVCFFVCLFVVVFFFFFFFFFLVFFFFFFVFLFLYFLGVFLGGAGGRGDVSANKSQKMICSRFKRGPRQFSQSCVSIPLKMLKIRMLRIRVYGARFCFDISFKFSEAI